MFTFLPPTHKDTKSHKKSYYSGFCNTWSLGALMYSLALMTFESAPLYFNQNIDLNLKIKYLGFIIQFLWLKNI